MMMCAADDGADDLCDVDDGSDDDDDADGDL